MRKSGGEAFGDDEGDIVVLLVRAELADFVDDRGAQSFARKPAVTAKRVDEALFSKFFARGAEGLCDAIGVEEERVAQRELALREGAIPNLEDTHNGGGGGKALERIIGVQEERRKVTTVGVADTASGVVIFGEEESGEGGIGGVGAEKLIDRAQEAVRLIESEGALAAQVGLKIGHKESGSNALAGNIGDH